VVSVQEGGDKASAPYENSSRLSLLSWSQTERERTPEQPVQNFLAQEGGSCCVAKEKAQ
jgi:hypothetical protein